MFRGSLGVRGSSPATRRRCSRERCLSHCPAVMRKVVSVDDDVSCWTKKFTGTRPELKEGRRTRGFDGRLFLLRELFYSCRERHGSSETENVGLYFN